jgi:hypothetical protein
MVSEEGNVDGDEMEMKEMGEHDDDEDRPDGEEEGLLEKTQGDEGEEEDMGLKEGEGSSMEAMVSKVSIRIRCCYPQVLLIN